MQQQFENLPGQLTQRPLKVKSDGPFPSGKRDTGELLYFAQLAREAVRRIETEKSLRKLSLKINQAHELELLEMRIRRHEVLTRALAVLSRNLNAAA
jgi:hypothetical protein